jgi:adenylosuccinate lyase
VEQHVCEALGLGIEPASTQVVARDRHAAFLAALGLAGATLERFATEIRHLQRSEVAEVREPFAAGQKGSSAMPHKRNPIVSENTTGMARLLRGWTVAGLEDVALWHERDISHSAVERVALPDACAALDYALTRMLRLIEGMEVDTDRMLRNLEATGGLVFTQALLLGLVETGMPRDDAYRVVQQAAATAREQRRNLHEVASEDPEVTLDPDRLAACFDAGRIVETAAEVFERLEAARL